ncbi:helix-turn-helix domain-containing protein [Pseudonocardia sp. GCM10023141]|uniref:helix-turn-helix domain-containing protein n=1 Tax=Pseudonocardia sp. GCM10023141 TaxID=3252653 RepID=UPI0036074691
MNLRDPAASRAESFTPTVRRLLAGEFDEGSGYATYRSRGTTDWLLFHTIAGRGRLGPGVFVEPRETALIRPGTPHDYGVEPAMQRWHFLYAHFHPRPDWLPLLDWPEVAPGLLVLRAGADGAERIRGSLAACVRHQDSVLPQGEQLGMNALEAALLWCDTQNPAAARIDDRLLRAIEHVDRHLRADLSVAVLAGVSNLSVSRFAHVFRSQLGTTPQQFVERRRLDTACRLLELTSRPVASVAAEAGFPNPLYFSTRFRQHTGHSPAQYRRRLGAPPPP